jgi:ABC-2 type transport system ATP-binding protein
VTHRTEAGAVALRSRGLHRRFGDTVAVRSLDLEVHRGECFGLLGPNGAGKTTTIEILEGLQTPDAGEVEVLGLRWEHDARSLRPRLGIQLQETELPDKLTVEETVRLFRAQYPRGPAVEELVRQVELAEKRKTWVRDLSGGQRQRLSLACALAGEPDVLFLDEPTTGLDPQSRRHIWNICTAFRDAGGTILLTTHFMDEAERLADRIAIMDHGAILVQGTPRELIDSLGGDHVVEFAVEGGEGVVPLEALRGLAGVTGLHAQDGRVRLTVRRLHTVVPTLLDVLSAEGVALAGLTTHTATLEDVFVSLTGRGLRD